MTTPQQPELPALSERITQYLVGGGLFNPECANHDAVRDLLIECRAFIDAQAAVLADRESRKVVAWRWVPSAVWKDYVLTDDPEKAKEAREVGIEVEELTVAAPGSRQDGWIPIETAPADEVVAVFWIDREGQQQHDLDFREEGECWSRWHDHAEHTEIIGGHGVPYTAPYTHWKHLGAPSKVEDKP